MIVDGVITYPGVHSTLKTWQPQNPAVYAIVVATLTTVLSYQATSLVFDLALGFKRRGQARITDLGTLLLTDEASLPALCASLWDNSFIARWKFHGFRAHCPQQELGMQRMRWGVFLKFLALLVVAPLVNLLTIVLNIESDTIVTFENAQFGGIALGVNNNLTGVLKSRPGDTCSSYEPRLARLETPLTEFLTCRSDVFVDDRDEERESVATFKLSRREGDEGTPIDSVVAEFKHGKLSSRVIYHADVYVSTQGKAYRLRPVLTLGQAKRLFQGGIEQQLKECGNEGLGNMQEKLLSTNEDAQNQQWEVSQQVSCVAYAESQSKAVIVTMIEPLTLVDDEKFEVVELKDTQSGEVEYPQFESGIGFPFLKRRRTIASFLTLIIAVVSVVLLRIVTTLVTNHDIYIGIELLLKDKFGISCCDSMLQATRKVQYRGRTEQPNMDTRLKIIKQEISEWEQSRQNGRHQEAG